MSTQSPTGGTLEMGGLRALTRTGLLVPRMAYGETRDIFHRHLDHRRCERYQAMTCGGIIKGFLALPRPLKSMVLRYCGIMQRCPPAGEDSHTCAPEIQTYAIPGS